MPTRKIIRAKFHDYNGGIYFVTACTKAKKHYFGKIIDAEIQLSQLGEILKNNIENIKDHFPEISIPLYVVMPNHFHAIICIEGETLHKNPQSDEAEHINSKLSVVIGSIKAHVKRSANNQHIEFFWQSRFHDRIIRSNDELNKIATYIENNVALWDHDCFR